LHYANPERKGRIKTARTTIFDLYCITGKGERIIVEVQNQSHKNFKERGLSYAFRAIQDQEKKGKGSKFELCPVYVVNIVNFRLNKRIKTEKYASYVQLMDRDTYEVFYDKLTFIYLELIRFKKKEEDLQNNVEKWMYIFKYLHKLKNLPKNLHSEVFQKLFEQAKIANMTPEEYDAYNKSLKKYRHMNIVVDEYKEKVAAKNKTIAAMKKKDAEQAKIIAEYQRRFGVLTSLN
jgi:predicted transposase/invertase (TIGR01784 family)